MRHFVISFVLEIIKNVFAGENKNSPLPIGFSELESKWKADI